MHAIGGFLTIPHNELRDLTAFFHRASTNIRDGARVDVTMSGFWGRAGMRRSIGDVKIFSPMLLPTETATLSLATGDMKG